MRIDSHAQVGGFGAIFVRGVVRRLNNDMYWNEAVVRKMTKLDAHQNGEFIKMLENSGFAKANRGKNRGTWTTTPLAQRFAAASGAKPITRKTAEEALDSLLDRIVEVNRRTYFLAKITRLVVFGSFLRREVDRLGDLDVAIELQPKDPDRQKLRVANYEHVARLESIGRRIDGFMRREGWWRSEVFTFLKGRRRALSLHDYSTEKQLIDSVPHEEIPIPAQKRKRLREKDKVRARRGAEDQSEWF